MRAGFERWITLLIGVAIVALAVIAGAFLIDLTTSVRAGHPAQAGTSASASPDTMQMGQAHVPTNNNCVLCHESGGTAGLKIVPAILHPIDGWRRCLTCHTDDTLGRTAPGHQGIAETECLNCHKVAQAGPAITQPHAALHDQHCLDCHGTVAHLPSSMASSKETACVLCHKPTDLPPPTYHHVADPRLSCRSCHRSEEVGNLPIDHALRDDSTCLLCHDVYGATPSASALPDATGLPPKTSPLPTLPVPTVPASLDTSGS